ncbi:MAG: NAD(P)H-dependent oxidoreductase subunit E, partial [Acidobacteriota bacterium]
MDLKLMKAVPAAEERAAVDEVLGPPEGSWEGGKQGRELDGHITRGGHDLARRKRHLLLPALHGVQAHIGWISEGALNYICQRLTIPPAEAFGVASFYAMFATEYRPPRVAHLCDDIACKLAGAEALAAKLTRILGPPGSTFGEAGDGECTWLRSPCLGLCERAPAVMFQLAGDDGGGVMAPASEKEITRVLAGAAIPPRKAVSAPQTVEPREPNLRLLRRVGVADPTSLHDYRAHGGYSALRRAIELGPEGVIREMADSKVLGRGGAAFPMGRKWAAVAGAPVRPHYILCNADESEPGTFKDRVIMEADPFAVIEAMTVAGYAVGAEQGFLYIRGEYALATKRLQDAVAEARLHGLLGDDVMDEGIRFDIELRRGAGAYICGEETALFNSIEGFRGEPR